MNTNNRRTFSTPSRIALSVLAILASTADAQAVTEWDLPGQPLANTLRDIAARTESNIIFDKKLVKGQSAPPLKTRATTEEALSKVLEGTGLTYRQLDDKTVTIQLASTDPASATSASYSNEGRIRLAQAETPRPRPLPEMGLPSVMLLEEIIVTGTNIRGIENNTAPITVLSREYINATGYSTTTKLLESVTQNFALANQSSTGLGGVSNGNQEQGSSVNLRGIGEGTTLVLVNGRRFAPGYRSAAVDISALPLSAIERVEILPDGASALYGSDAVGGVVNFILREDFEGAETRLRAGAADGVNEYRASQAIGNAWDSGNFLASVEYYQRDALLATDRDFVPNGPVVGTLLPEDENYSGVVRFKQDLSGSVSVFTDVLYTQRDSFNRAGRALFNETADTDNTQAVMTAGVDWNIAGDWQIELSGSYASNEIDQILASSASGAPVVFLRDSSFDVQTAEIKGDGSLFTLPGGNVRMAIGAAYRGESFDDTSTDQASGIALFQSAKDQNVRSAFAEFYVPVVGESNAMAGLQKLELSVAGRYDDYSTAGSSFDPQAGVMWEPVSGLRLRARHSTSYKAPNLIDYSFANNSGYSALLPGVPGFGTAQIMAVTGTDVTSLRPQESESASFGLELTPESLTGFAMSLNYYKIRYNNIVATPGGTGDAFSILANPAAYPNLIFVNPGADLVNRFIVEAQRGPGGFLAFAPDFTIDPNFDPNTVQVLVDGRRRNLSVVRSEGVDLAAQYDFKAGADRFFVGVNGTYILNQEQQVTPLSAEIDTVDTIYNPPHWRARGFVGWSRMGWSTNLFVNHTDSYVDNRSPVPTTVDSYTTIDLRVAYDFSAQFNSGVLSGVVVALSAQNALDEDPPRTAVLPLGFDPGYDGTNADPLGRLIGLEITKAW